MKTLLSFYYKLHVAADSRAPSMYRLAFKYRRVLKYIAAGGTAAVTDLLFLYIFTDWFGWHYLFSAVIAFLVAFGVSFILQKFWAFGDRNTDGMHKQAAIYLSVQAVNLLVNTLLIYLFVEWLSLWYMAAQFFAGIMIAVSSFFIYRTFIFKTGTTGMSKKAISDVNVWRRHVHPAALFIFIGLVVYLPVWFHFQSLVPIQILNGMNERFAYPVYGSDSAGYVLLADGILTHRVFTSSEKAPFVPETFRTPGYPALLAVFKGITGSYKFFPLFQLVLTILTACLIALMGKKIWSERVGIAAGILFMVDPTTIFHTLVLMSEISYVFFIVLSVYLIFFYKPKRKFLDVVLAGAALGLATLIRPISIYLPLVFIIFLLAKNFKFLRLRYKELVASSLLFLFCVGFFVLPWGIRNQQVSGVFGLSSVADFNFFHYYIPEFLSYKLGITPDAARGMVYSKLGSVPPQSIASLTHAPLLRTIWLHYFWDDPSGYLKFHLVKTIPFFLSGGIKSFIPAYNDLVSAPVFSAGNANLTNLLLHREWKSFFEEASKVPAVFVEELILFLVLLFSFVPLFARRTRLFAVLSLCLIFYFALLTGSVAYSRFRIPASPFLFLSMAAGIAIIYKGITEAVMPRRLMTKSR